MFKLYVNIWEDLIYFLPLSMLHFATSVLIALFGLSVYRLKDYYLTSNGRCSLNNGLSNIAIDSFFLQTTGAIGLLLFCKYAKKYIRF